MTMTEDNTELKTGRVVAIAGPVIDAEFPAGALPEINTAVEMTVNLEGTDVVITGSETSNAKSSWKRFHVSPIPEET